MITHHETFKRSIIEDLKARSRGFLGGSKPVVKGGKIVGWKPISPPEDQFVFFVKGDSMSPTYDEGNLLICQETKRRPKVGQPVVVYYRGGFYVKRLIKIDGALHLAGDNPAYKPLKVNGECFILGKVIERQRASGIGPPA